MPLLICSAALPMSVPMRMFISDMQQQHCTFLFFTVFARTVKPSDPEGLREAFMKAFRIFGRISCRSEGLQISRSCQTRCRITSGGARNSIQATTRTTARPASKTRCKVSTLRVLFGGAEKPRACKPSVRVIEEEELLMQALAEELEDNVPDDGAIEIDSEDEYHAPSGEHWFFIHQRANRDPLMDSGDSVPFFPPELEREIFESAAELYPDTIPSLLLVSQRVNEWIERIKYNTVTSSGSAGSCRLSALRRAIQSDLKPASFFHKHVRHLFVDTNEDCLPQIISACKGIRSLTVLFDPSETISFVGTELLLTCKKLQVLIRMDSTGYSDNLPSIEDVHFVSMVLKDDEYEDDWIIGTKGGMDFWARADAFVAKKRRGEIKPGSCSAQHLCRF
ncbi:hypothetical protein C8R44DRAFT_850141 [Mycena epipterygia]|nr:hypothetical protein C8R44DRAFT_850141 [Mycena epipterygia]